MNGRTIFLFALLLSSCGTAKPQPDVKRVILAPSAMQGLLKQCSRDTPAMGESAWKPTDADIDEMEAAVPVALAKSPKSRVVDFSGLFTKWRRQYGGLVRGGRRFIYGNYFPVDDSPGWSSWREEPQMVCDGGPRFFGVEFDVAAKRVTRIDFNGSVAG